MISKNVAWGLGLAALFGFMIYKGQENNWKKAEAAKAFSDKINSQLDDAEKKGNTAALLNKLIVDIAYSGRPRDGDTVRVVNVRYPEKSVRQRALEQIQLGYQVTDPINPKAISRLAEEDCEYRARYLERNNKNYGVDDVVAAWQLANADLQVWLPYVQYRDLTEKGCEATFQVMLRKLQDKKDKELNAKNIGAAVGKVTGTIGNLWDQSTKPISDAVNGVVDDFKSGYSEATK